MSEVKYSPDMSVDQMRLVPKEILKQIYDANDSVLFGSHYIKGKVIYNYIPGEMMTTGNPLIINVEIDYDGKGNSDLPESVIIKNYLELPTMFPDNKFSK